MALQILLLLLMLCSCVSPSCGLATTLFRRLARSAHRLSPLSGQHRQHRQQQQNIISRVGRSAVPPILILLFGMGVSPASASPLNPQLVQLRSPFFQGWLLRTVDHTQGVSVMFIVGSFSASSCGEFTEHYVFCAANQRGKLLFHEEYFPPPASVRVTGDLPARRALLSSSAQHSPPPLNVTWAAAGLGSFTLEEGRFSADFALGETAIRLEGGQRSPWSREDLLDGPEGWLGYTTLLPCHYFVHSVGSPCRYSLTLPRHGTGAESLRRGQRLEGRGYTHVEGNHGTFFPKGWCWAQAVSADNDASLSLVLGEFDIGPARPLSVVLFCRTRKHGTFVFRTTDLDRISIRTLDCAAGRVQLVASSLLPGRPSVELLISAPPGSFGPPVHIPTAGGFSSDPGCRESYEATALMRVVGDGGDVLEEESLPLACLEFGNAFLK